MISRYKVEIKWAFIFIGTLLFWSLLERLLGLHDAHIDKHEYFSMLFIIPAITIYVVALREKKRFYNGQMSFKQGFVAGLIMTLIVTAFTPLTQLIISKVITPNYFENVIAFSVQEGYDTLEAAQAYFNYKNYAIQSTVFSLVMGVVTSLIVALFLKTKQQRIS